jgi:hypothetical protein
VRRPACRSQGRFEHVFSANSYSRELLSDVLQGEP